MKKYSKYVVIALALFISPLIAKAQSGLEVNYHPLAFTDEVKMIRAENNESFLIPYQWEALTPSYEYSFITPGLYDPSRPLDIKIHYPKKTNSLKKLFSFDFISSVWRPVPAIDHPEEQYMSYRTDATSAWLRILTQPDYMASGKASWYKYKEGLFAASPDYPKGTKLRVTNTYNGKKVDVVVNDYGPDRSIHPDRVIDLDRVAFAKIAPLSAGLANVSVEVITDEAAQVAPEISTDLYPDVSARNAVIVNESTGEVIWGKDEKKSVPIASLTKMISVKVFLDTQPDLQKVVTYKKQDILYNYEHCSSGIAYLRVSEGDTMTVEDLLYSTLLNSHNNSIESLVRVSGLSRIEFIARMNNLARDLGAHNTHFVEPSGLSALNVSSAYDYAIISREIFKNPLIEKISSTKNYRFSTINTKKTFNLTNTNREILTPGLVGSKTGYLHKSLNCLMTRIKTDKGNILAINLGSSNRDAGDSDNKKLIEYGLSALN